MRSSLTAIFVLLSLTVWAQSDQWSSLSGQDREIVQVVIDIFEGMRRGDSAMVKSNFYAHASANTAFIEEDGSPKFRVDDIKNWFSTIGKPRAQIWDERIWDYEVRRDLNLATVWVRYAFYLDHTFHHCGVDALQLAFDGERWKVFHIADTRQIEGCNIPDHIAAGATY